MLNELLGAVDNAEGKAIKIVWAAVGDKPTETTYDTIDTLENWRLGVTSITVIPMSDVPQEWRKAFCA